jgi:hypothetical protein
VWIALAGACGGSNAKPPEAPAASGPPQAVDETASKSSPPPNVSPTATIPSPAPTYDDPKESKGPIKMTALVAKPFDRGKFPKQSVGDKACWQGIELTGKHESDYANIVDKCGTPTGLVEYAKPVSGKLHHEHDKRDEYVLTLSAGLCYRYFAVADAGIKDLDILIQTPNGALVGDDKTSQPVAIIESDKTWCMDRDAEYHFLIEVDGPGTGGYSFGVWARPK